MTKSFLVLISISILILSCEQQGKTKFTLLNSEKTGVSFKNEILEDEKINIINEEYLYNGGGVAAADFNNDGFTDLFFTGNMVSNALYINNGDFTFEDVSEASGIEGRERWKSGVALIDINNDGLLDIYVCSSIDENPSRRRNMLYVHQGITSDGKVSFKDEAAAYGIDDDSYSSNAVFIDYDNDGDQDLFILVNSKQEGVQTNYRQKVVDGTSNLTDILYENNGDGTFTNVSKEAGILIEGHGLGVSVLDINEDGWLDIYIANDFQTNDVLYVNHQGIFIDDIDKYFKHQSKFSMGTDAADINNNGKQDLITLDMMPEVNERKKTVIQGGNYISYINDAKYGYTHQYTRNMLQLNNGLGQFSEIGQFSGIHQTEWSWSPLIADFDNDGYRDLLITNGFPKDLTDKDFINFRTQINQVASPEYLMSQLPSVKVPNYAYKNNGDNTFSDVSEEWGMTQPSFSNGAAFADLDNDGDLDYVVNNINDEAFIFRNNTRPSELETMNFLRVALTGPEGNFLGLGTRLYVYYDGQSQFHAHSIYRGYISSVEPTVHFGLGSSKKVDSLVVIWPDQSKSSISQIEINTKIEVAYDNVDKVKYTKEKEEAENLYTEVSESLGINFKASNYDIIDFTYQRTLPHKFTQYGPSLAVGDFNSDGKEDFIIGSQNDQFLLGYTQNARGGFDQVLIDQESGGAAAGILLFDADDDQDLDMYVVKGGYEMPAGDTSYNDRFYRNDQGEFALEMDAIPTINSSGSVARAADIDNDGDLDIFVGSRVIPHKYPAAPISYFLENDGGKFTLVDMGLDSMGMISDAIWTDFDNDGDVDLITVGEFTSIRIYENIMGSLSELKNSGLEEYKGWWNSIVSGDFDNDGDTDYIAGNFGNNNSYAVSKDHPMFIHALDVDNNGSVDPILSCYLKFSDGSYKLCPVNYWEELSALSPVFRKRFDSYKSFGRATLDSVLTKEEIDRSLVLKTNHMLSSYIENLGGGKFNIRALPSPTQIAPIFGMSVSDINDDNFLDVLLVGNDFGNEVGVGKLDALNGMILLGDGAGNFEVQGNGLRGFSVAGDAKALVQLNDGKSQIIIASQNKDSLMVFQALHSLKVLKVAAGETSANLEFQDGSQRKVEFHYGEGFSSQSSRTLTLNEGVVSVTFYSKGKQSRKLDVEQLTL